MLYYAGLYGTRRRRKKKKSSSGSLRSSAAADIGITGRAVEKVSSARPRHLMKGAPGQTGDVPPGLAYR